MKLFAVCLLLSFALAASAAKVPEHTIFVKADNGFDTTIIAALTKKHVPVQPVDSKDNADYTLDTAPVHVHMESTGSKIARCLFAYCAGISDSGSTSVELIDNKTHAIVWGYNVMKGNGEHKDQSMAEAIAKHLKSFLSKEAKSEK